MSMKLATHSPDNSANTIKKSSFIFASSNSFYFFPLSQWENSTRCAKICLITLQITKLPRKSSKTYHKVCTFCPISLSNTLFVEIIFFMVLDALKKIWIKEDCRNFSESLQSQFPNHEDICDFGKNFKSVNFKFYKSCENFWFFRPLLWLAQLLLSTQHSCRDDESNPVMQSQFQNFVQPAEEKLCAMKILAPEVLW